jgi:hypothetical protein
MTLTITAGQRDLLYEEILIRLAAVGDINLALKQKDWEAATRLGMAFSDDLRLVSQDLGWGPRQADEPVELTSPPDVLRRAMSRWRDALLGIDAAQESERKSLRESQTRNYVVVEACRSVLANLDAAS